jgi:hypothetical protein
VLRMTAGRHRGPQRPSADTRLSVCSLSAAPLERTARILRGFHDVADEIVCAVDSRVPESQLVALDGQVDILERCEFDPSTGIERHLAWLHGLCSGTWILRIDSDEVPSAALISELPRMIEAPDVLQYVIPCRWVFPDRRHFLDERPWSEDWHVRLVRNEPVALRIPGVLHSNINGVEPLRYVDLPFYHLTCIIHTREEREAKVARYESSSAPQETLEGWSVNNHYLPERFQRRPSSPVPPEDVLRITGVLDPDRHAHPTSRRRWSARRGPVDVVPLAQVDQNWPRRQVRPTAYRATWLRTPQVTELLPGELRRVFVEVRNDGSETWPFGSQEPAFRLCYRWMSADGEEVVADGIPSTFTANVAPGTAILQPMTIHGPHDPGEYKLAFCLVHEGVRWFAQGPVQSITVRREANRRHSDDSAWENRSDVVAGR